MGLSTTYANVVMFSLVLTVLTLMFSQFASYLGETRSDVAIQGDYLARRLDTSIKLASVTASSNVVSFYVLNDGRAPLIVNCTDYYVDRQWVPPAGMLEVLILNDTFDPGLWNSHEALKVRVDYSADEGVAHEVKVVSCNGVADSMVFYR
jgi:hypothetical protein